MAAGLLSGVLLEWKTAVRRGREAGHFQFLERSGRPAGIASKLDGFAASAARLADLR